MTPLIAMLDAIDAFPVMIRLRSRSYDLLRLEPGTSVVDVGCGTGLAVSELSELGVRGIGVDLSDEMISVAKDRHPGRDFLLGSAYELPLADGEVAGFRADKVMHVLPDAGQALREAARVLRPGGRIVLTGHDWDTFVIDSDQPRLTRTIVHARADLVPAPRAARRSRNLLLDAGFAEVEAEAHTGVFTHAAIVPLLTGLADAALDAGAVSEDEHRAWTAEQRERAERGRLFLALPVFVASATKRP